MQELRRKYLLKKGGGEGGTRQKGGGRTRGGKPSARGPEREGDQHYARSTSMFFFFHMASPGAEGYSFRKEPTEQTPPKLLAYARTSSHSKT